jgi:hypothetical protein
VWGGSPLGAGEVVVFEDLRHTGRFTAAGFLRRHGVASSMSATLTWGAGDATPSDRAPAGRSAAGARRAHERGTSAGPAGTPRALDGVAGGLGIVRPSLTDLLHSSDSHRAASDR